MRIAKRISERFHRRKKKPVSKQLSKHYAPMETVLLVHADRINQRIYDFVQAQKKRNKYRTDRYETTYTEKDLDEILRAISIIIAQDLNTKGKEEWKWKEQDKTTTRRSSH